MTFKGSYKKGGLAAILIIQDEQDWDRGRGKEFQLEQRVGTWECRAAFGGVCGPFVVACSVRLSFLPVSCLLARDGHLRRCCSSLGTLPHSSLGQERWLVVLEFGKRNWACLVQLTISSREPALCPAPSRCKFYRGRCPQGGQWRGELYLWLGR